MCKSVRLVLVYCFFAVLIVLIAQSECKRRKKQQQHMSLILRKKETNAIDFIRLAVMRLVYGVATRFGFEEQISEAFNGAFVPPGVDDYDDYSFGLRDDYDY